MGAEPVVETAWQCTTDSLLPARLARDGPISVQRLWRSLGEVRPCEAAEAERRSVALLELLP